VGVVINQTRPGVGVYAVGSLSQARFGMLLKIVVGGYLAVSAPTAWARINEPAPFNVDNLVRIPQKTSKRESGEGIWRTQKAHDES
jgi:hypothetical protein